MKIDSIKRYLRPQAIMQRKSTFANAFASVLAPHDAYSQEAVANALVDLGQDPERDLECVYCGKEAATWDHVFNRVIKGEFSGHGHRVRNLVPCCRTCNERKGQRPWREWLAVVAPGDEVYRASRIERFLSHAGSTLVTPADMRRHAEGELRRYEEIRETVFALMREADGLAAIIREKSDAAVTAAEPAPEA